MKSIVAGFVIGWCVTRTLDYIASQIAKQRREEAKKEQKDEQQQPE